MDNNKDKDKLLERAILMSIANMSFEEDCIINKNNDVISSVKDSVAKAKVLKKEVNNARYLG